MTALNSNVTNITADTWTQVWGGGIRDVTGLHDCKVDLMVQNRGSAPASVLVAVTYSDVAPTSDTDAGIIDRTQVGIGRILQQPNIAVPSGGCIWLKSSEDATCFVGGNLDDVDPPGWVTEGADLDFDFENGQYWIGTYGGRDLPKYAGFTVGASSSRWAAVNGTYTEFGSGEAILTENGLITLPGYTNKCDLAWPPTDLTGVTKSGDAAATLTLVDDTAELAAAGLSDISGGKAYKLDNTGGSGDAYFDIAGATVNTNDHDVVALARVTAGTATLSLDGSTGDETISGSEYSRIVVSGVTPADNAQVVRVTAPAGAVVLVTLPGLFEGSAPPDGVIVPPASGGNATSACAITLPTTGWYTPTGFTVLWEGRRTDAGSGGVVSVWQMNDGTQNERVAVLDYGAHWQTRISVGGSQYFSATHFKSGGIGDLYRVAMTWEVGASVIVSTGQGVSSGTPAAIPAAVPNFDIGHQLGLISLPGHHGKAIGIPGYTDPTELTAWVNAL